MKKTIKIKDIDKEVIPLSFKNLICLLLDSTTKEIEDEIFNIDNKTKKEIIIDIV